MNWTITTEAGIGAVTALLGICAVGTLSPRSRLFAPVIYKGQVTNPPCIALTFDDGPNPQVTPAILDILEKHGVKATFFVIGTHASRWPDIVRRAHAQGHLIANHSFDHAWYGMFRSWNYWEDQIRRTDEVIANITGELPTLFRPPLGFKQPLMARAIRRCPHHIVTWSKRAYDGLPTTPQAILKTLATNTQAGDIILLHDGHEPRKVESRQPTLLAIEPLIRALRQREFQIVRLDALPGLL